MDSFFDQQLPYFLYVFRYDYLHIVIDYHRIQRYQM